MSHQNKIPTKNHYDLIVIGGGSGGLATAKQAAAYGAKVALIEMNRLGGTCVNKGCVPKKIMWYAGEMANTFHFAKDYGFQYENFMLDFETLVKNREQHIKRLHEAYEKQLRDNKVNYIHGFASFLDTHTIQVNSEPYTANHFVIATGCHPARPHLEGAEFGIDSDGFFDLTHQPKHIAIIGAGYIAVELASILNQLGSQVKILMRHEKLLRQFDPMICHALTEIMTNQGIQLLPHHPVTKITRSEHHQFTIHVDNQKPITGIDSLIFAIGRTPRTKLLNLNTIGVKTNDEGFIITDKWEITSIPHIYALGDVTGKKLLTPVAIAAGRHLAARVFGQHKDSCLDYNNIPTVIFGHPPIGSLGLSEQEAIQRYGKDQLVIYQTQFNSLFYSLSENKIPSSMKLITLKPNEKIIGCHIIGLGADEMLQGFAVAIKMGATKKDFEETVAIHPTSAETLTTI